MADFNKPATTDTYANFLAYINAKISDLALHLDPATTSPTNVPTNAIRWNSANNQFEKYSGTAWAALSATWAFTNITASGTLSVGGAATFSGGNANGISYLNASKVLTTGSALTFDGTDFATTGKAIAASFVPTSSSVPTNGMYLPAANTLAWAVNSSENMRLTSGGFFGLGITPSSWLSGSGIFQMKVSGTSGNSFSLWGVSDSIRMWTNAYYNGSTYVRQATGVTPGAFMIGTDGSFLWQTVAPGTAGTTFLTSDIATKMSVDTYGNFALGMSPSGWEPGAKVIQIPTSGAGGTAGNTASLWCRADSVRMITGAYFNGGSYIYTATGVAPQVFAQWNDGSWSWSKAASGTVSGTVGSFTTPMTLATSGNLLLGTTTDYAWTSSIKALHIGSVASFSGETTGSAIMSDNCYFDGSAWRYMTANPAGQFYIGLNGDMYFRRAASGSANASISWANQMTIDVSGNVMVKKASLTNTGRGNYIRPDNGYGGGFCSTGDGSVNFSAYVLNNEGSGGTYYYVRGDGNVYNSSGTYGTISDIKHKENVVDATGKLADVLNLRVRNFNFKDNPNSRQIGFIAQEFETVFPTMVDASPDFDEDGVPTGETTKTIKTSVLIPVLVKAMQELNAKVEALMH
jgi:hypothetical protein